MMIQAAQQQLTAANMMLLNIQMNYVLMNDQTECEVNPNSEDLDLEEDDGSSALIRSTNEIISCCDANSFTSIINSLASTPGSNSICIAIRCGLQAVGVHEERVYKFQSTHSFYKDQMLGTQQFITSKVIFA
jgi:hypothetical protein